MGRRGGEEEGRGGEEEKERVRGTEVKRMVSWRGDWMGEEKAQHTHRERTQSIPY